MRSAGSYEPHSDTHGVSNPAAIWLTELSGATTKSALATTGNKERIALVVLNKSITRG